MIGELPERLRVDGQWYSIRADYRNILRIIVAFGDEDLTEAEKMYICLRRIYTDFLIMPKEIYSSAAEAAIQFIECDTRKSNQNKTKTVDWEKDEQLIFPAINAVAGFEVRSVPYMHWWTFLGYFQSVNPESLWGFVLTIRQKKAKHRKLEKHEQEFFNANRAICDLQENGRKRKEAALNYMDALYSELSTEEV